MAVPLVPGPGLGDANAAQKSMSTLPENQCDFCAVLIEPKQVSGSTCPTSPRLPWRDRLPLGSHLASHAHAAPVHPSACLIGATPALPAVRGPRHALCDAWRGHRAQDMGAGRAPMHNSST